MSLVRETIKLKEELAANKQRRREERKKVKMEAKIDKPQNRLAAKKADKDEEVKQKGHRKYLDCQFLTDTSYHDESVVPFQTPVSSVRPV